MLETLHGAQIHGSKGVAETLHLSPITVTEYFL